MPCPINSTGYFIYIDAPWENNLKFSIKIKTIQSSTGVYGFSYNAWGIEPVLGFKYQ